MKKKPTVLKPPKQKQKRQMARRDWEELMGVNRSTYKRKSGSIRQK